LLCSSFFGLIGRIVIEAVRLSTQHRQMLAACLRVRQQLRYTSIKCEQLHSGPNGSSEDPRVGDLPMTDDTTGTRGPNIRKVEIQWDKLVLWVRRIAQQKLADFADRDRSPGERRLRHDANKSRRRERGASPSGASVLGEPTEHSRMVFVSRPA
jgi:hypothetical protein